MVIVAINFQWNNTKMMMIWSWLDSVPSKPVPLCLENRISWPGRLCSSTMLHLKWDVLTDFTLISKLKPQLHFYTSINCSLLLKDNHSQNSEYASAWVHLKSQGCIPRCLIVRGWEAPAVVKGLGFRPHFITAPGIWYERQSFGVYSSMTLWPWPNNTEYKGSVLLNISKGCLSIVFEHLVTPLIN